MRSVFRKAVFILSAIALIMAAFALMLYFGIIHPNNPSKKKYPVRGVDVSSYQGVIDWNELSGRNIDFAYIKATEGSSHVDPYFNDNWNNAKETELCIGAYHFFSFESSGEDQAQHIIDTVSKDTKMLPLVIDVEYYGGFKTVDDIDVSKVKKELRALIDLLEKEYGTKPVIYVSSDTYETIIQDDFKDCGLWYRSVYMKVPKDVDWTFWQYSNRHVLRGYKGKERYIDMNIFNGTKEEFLDFYEK
ncbi:glycoside hydrolase family 25 [Butyrivibrio sp. X503]|uniref:GH25 family lysozyme n=1 Tax=Butyrivibrio sp. X503 TaxID=2364878 RepID=UPI000EAAAD42|nr:GH25 family lysozyme [Butyrivibrio sp. X503]RKM54347.1 glycoside hydrolase family 25 [Butyrivibrio sp. X503]